MKKSSNLASVVGIGCFVLIIAGGLFSNVEEVRGQPIYDMFRARSDLTYAGKNALAGQWFYIPSNYDSWRYGNWGGINYGSGTPVDAMDALFKSHDEAYAKARGNIAKIRLADAWLLGMLKALPLTRLPDGTGTYKTFPAGAPEFIQYNGGKTKKLAPFSEFARQQAIQAFYLRIQFNGYKK